MTNKGSNPFARMYENFKLIEHGRFFSDRLVAAALQKMIELSKIGARVKEGAQKSRTRRHELGDLIGRTYNALATDGHEPTTDEVLGALKAKTYDGEDIIQEVTDDAIHWCNWRGNEHKMKISTLRNRLTSIRKRRKQA